MGRSEDPVFPPWVGFAGVSTRTLTGRPMVGLGMESVVGSSSSVRGVMTRTLTGELMDGLGTESVVGSSSSVVRGVITWISRGGPMDGLGMELEGGFVGSDVVRGSVVGCWIVIC